MTDRMPARGAEHTHAYAIPLPEAEEEPREGPARAPRLRITEIYRSIQGESTYVGRPCTFVRLTGCALRCVWCDSTFTFTGGEWMSLDAVLSRVRSLGADLVEFTGGEPLLQADVHAAIRALCDGGSRVLVETGGDQDLTPLDPRAVAIVDVKCPGSGMHDRMDWANLGRLRGHDELKFVLDGRADYEWARGFVRERDLARGGRVILFSCVFGRLEPRDLAAWILEDALPVRLQLQLHKILWDPDTRGT
jgi:7-carboxy-7-deazaguanine synthase